MDVRIGSYESPNQSLARRVIAQAIVDLTTPGRTERTTAAMALFSNEPHWATWRLHWGREAGYHPDAMQRRALARIKKLEGR